MVEHVLAKDEIGVRFPVSAPYRHNLNIQIQKASRKPTVKQKDLRRPYGFLLVARSQILAYYLPKASRAPVVKWISQRSSEPSFQVRVLTGAQQTLFKLVKDKIIQLVS